MITALISAVTGLFSGIVPDIMKEIRDTRAHSREIEFLQINQKLALERVAHEASVKIEESNAKQTIAEIEANEKQFQQIMAQAMQQTGVEWIDMLNAAIRPITAALFMLLFAGGLATYWFGVSTPNDAFAAAMSGLYGEMMMGVIGWFFGFRSYKTLRPVAA